MATHLDGLYPEWDEFYLLVCEFCSIIIRPQALEKHMATKHRIVQQQQQLQPQTQQPQPQLQPIPKQSQNINSKSLSMNHCTSIGNEIEEIKNSNNKFTLGPESVTNTQFTPFIGYTPNSNHREPSQQQQQQFQIQQPQPQPQPIPKQPQNINNKSIPMNQQIPSRQWGGKHALGSLPKPAIRRRPCDWVKVRRAPDTNPFRVWL